MEAEALSSLVASGASRDEIIFERTADMRYVGQFYEIPSTIPNGTLGTRHVSEITETFYQTYEKAFGRFMTDAPIQGLTWRLRAQCPAPVVSVKFEEKQDKGLIISVFRKLVWMAFSGHLMIFFAKRSTFDRMVILAFWAFLRSVFSFFK